jgi:hypothetical protein
MRLLLLLWVFAGCAGAWQDSAQEDAAKLLLNIRKKVVQTVTRLPKYLCTETVDRSTFQPGVEVLNRSCDDLASRRKQTAWKIRKDTADRLRLDVAVSGDSEMFSWAGENHFQDGTLADLVRSGATSTGTFSSFLGSIFGSDAATFTYNGDVDTAGRVLAEFGFRVPLEKSKYLIGNKLRRSVVEYDGTFLVDPKSFDLVQLTIHADHLPADLNACESRTTLDYGSIRINNSEFPIPTNARWRVVNLDGSEFDNRTVFSACHEFLGESTLRFDVPSDGTRTVVEKTARKSLRLPPELPFSLVLTSPIDTATAAAGDLFQAKLTTAIKENHSGILVPKGAAVTGRIISIERYYLATFQFLILGVKLETIEAGSVPQPLDARLQSVVKRHKKAMNALVLRQDLGSFDQMSVPEDLAVGILRFDNVTADYVIHRGFEIEARTATTEAKQ